MDHDVKIGDFSHIAGNSYVAGGVTIGNLVLLGAGTTVLDGLSICSDVVVGAGAVVTKSITEPGTYVGAPARRIH